MYSQNNRIKFCCTFILFAYTLFGQTASQDVVHIKSVNQNLKAPTRIALDKSDNIYVIDSFFNTINKYNPSGSLIKTYSFENHLPVSIAIDSKNQVYFGSKNNGNIYRLFENGETSLIYSGLVAPVDMIFSPDDQLFISDGNLKIVVKIDKTGVLKQTITNGVLLSPSSLIYDTQNNRLLVAEAGIVGGGGSFGTTPCTVHIFNLDGSYIGNFGSGQRASFFGNGIGTIGNAKFNRIQGISIGKCNNIYVSDPFQGSISVFNENLSFITRFGVYGTAPGQLNVPLDIEFDSKGRIIISSMNNGSIEIFSIADVLPSSFINASNQTLCSGTSTLNIPIHFTGTAPWKFTYSLNEVLQTPIITSENPYLLEVSKDGVYEITALSDLNTTGTCFTGSATISKQLEPVTSLIQNSDAVLCEGGSTAIEVRFTGSGPWTFIYTVNGLNPQEITTSENPFIIRASQSGLYEISYIESNGCIGTSVGSANIQVNVKPTVQITNQKDQIKIFSDEMFGLKINFTGTAPWTFTYTVDEKNPTTITTSDNSYILYVKDPGTYEIISFSDAFCENTKTDDYPEINHFSINKPLSLSACNETQTYNLDTIGVELFGNIGSVQWFSDELLTKEITNTNSFTSKAITIYALTRIYDSFHKSFAVVPLTTRSGPTINILASNTNVCSGESVTLTAEGGQSYSWDNNVQNGVPFIPTVTKEYTVTGRDSFGCTNTARIIIVVDSNCKSPSISDYVNSDTKKYKDALLLYPNPSKGEFTLTMMTPTAVNSNINITIVNRFAQVIVSDIIKSNEINFNSPFIYKDFKLTHLKKGVYFVNVRTNNYVQTARLIIVD